MAGEALDSVPDQASLGGMGEGVPGRAECEDVGTWCISPL